MRLAITSRRRRRARLWREIVRVARADLDAVAEEIAALEAAVELDDGRAPALRRVIVDGHPAPYWRSPAHAGYYGSGSSSLDGLLALPSGVAVGAVAAESLLDAVIDMVNPF